MACCRLLLLTTRPHQRWKHLPLARNCALAYGNFTNTICSSVRDGHGGRMYSSALSSCGTSLSSWQLTDTYTACIIRRCSTLPDDTLPDSASKQSGNSETMIDSDYKLVYRFSHIRAMRAASMLKIYQTAAVVMSTPIVFYMYNTGTLTASEAGAMMGFSVMAAVMLFVMSNFFRKVVGFMYVSEDGMKVKIAHLTFWSRRNNLYLDMSDIVPLSDTDQKSSNAYIRLDTYTNVEKFYMFLAYGGNVLDKEALQKVLGGF